MSSCHLQRQTLTHKRHNTTNARTPERPLDGQPLLHGGDEAGHGREPHEPGGLRQQRRRRRDGVAGQRRRAPGRPDHHQRAGHHHGLQQAGDHDVWGALPVCGCARGTAGRGRSFPAACSQRPARRPRLLALPAPAHPRSTRRASWRTRTCPASCRSPSAAATTGARRGRAAALVEQTPSAHLPRAHGTLPPPPAAVARAPRAATSTATSRRARCAS